MRDDGENGQVSSAAWRCPECGAPAPAGGRWYDRAGKSYVGSDPLRLLDSIDTYVTKREDGPGYSVLEPQSGSVLAHGDVPEAARAGAMTMAAKLGGADCSNKLIMAAWSPLR